MAKTAIYTASVVWTGGHRGRLKLGNGPEMDFSAPPDSQGEAGVLTPEDAFVGAVNTCVMLMFIWAAERFRLDLVSYDCPAEGVKLVELDRTEIFTHVVLRPRIVVRAGEEPPEAVEKRVRRGLEAARKFSLIANSVKSEARIEPEIVIADRQGGKERDHKMEIEILGPGCPRCGEVEKRVKSALAELGVAASVEKITDIKAMMSFGILSTPGLVIDGDVKCAGRVPSAAEIKAWIQEAKA